MNEKIGIDDALQKGLKLDKMKEKEVTGINTTRIAEVLASESKFIYCGGHFYKWTINSHGGSNYNRLEDEDMSMIVLSKLRYKYKINYKREILDVLKSVSKINSNLLNNYENHINLMNGIFRISDQKMLPRDEKFYFSVQLPVVYTPEASCPVWLKTLDEIFDSDTDSIELLQDYFGYCLQPSTRSEKFMIFVGSGGNGKGVVCSVLRGMLGETNTSNLALKHFADDRYTGMLFGKMVNISNESSTSIKNWSDSLKSAVSGEPMISDEKYKDRFNFVPRAKHIFAMNEKPYLEDKSHGVSRRMIVLEFNKTFNSFNRDELLKESLRSEYTGIFNWMLVGLNRYLERGFSLTEKQDEIIRAYKIESDSAMSFVEEECTLNKFETEPKTDLYKHYQEYCRDNGFRAQSHKSFTRKLHLDYNVKDIRISNTRHYKGISYGHSLPKDEDVI